MGKHGIVIPRQRTALRKTVLIVVTIASAVLGLGGTRVALNGWDSFITRPPGVGSTPAIKSDAPDAPDAQQDDPVVTTTTKAPSTTKRSKR